LGLHTATISGALFVGHDRFPTYYGGEFTAGAVRGWFQRLQVKTLHIEPGSPWENGYNESFNGKFAMRYSTANPSTHWPRLNI
jgi:transposase InsO family protein